MNGKDLIRLFESLIGTLDASSSKLIGLDDEMLGYTVFEELSVDYNVFLQGYTLDVLIDKYIITDEITDKCKVLYNKINEIENSELWDMEYIKTNAKWLDVMNLSDEIKKMITDIWGKDCVESVKEHIIIMKYI